MITHATCQRTLDEIKQMLTTYGPEEDLSHRQVLLRMVDILEYLMGGGRPISRVSDQERANAIHNARVDAVQVAGVKEAVR
jgi:hypothetical protein